MENYTLYHWSTGIIDTTMRLDVATHPLKSSIISKCVRIFIPSGVSPNSSYSKRTSSNVSSSETVTYTYTLSSSFKGIYIYGI